MKKGERRNHIKDLKERMEVVHDSWDIRTSDPMIVKKHKGELMLYSKEAKEYTDFQSGGEDEWGWIIL